MPCCDVCAGTTRAWAQPAPFPCPLPAAVPGRAAPVPATPKAVDAGSLDDAILQVVESAQPPVGRTRAVEILRGGRSKVIAQHAYDGLPGYGAFGWMRADDVLARVDELLRAGQLRSTGGRFPKLRRRHEASPSSPRAPGTNLQALLDTVHGRDGSRSSPWPPTSRRRRRSSGPAPPGVAVGGVPVGRLRRPRRARPGAWRDWLAQRGVELVVLAGYMQLLSGEFLAGFPGRVINVHPALLPAFPGLSAVEQALDYGVKVFGVTVHFVDEGVDTGPVILQRAVELPRRPRARGRARAAARRSSTSCCPRRCG